MLDQYVLLYLSSNTSIITIHYLINRVLLVLLGVFLSQIQLQDFKTTYLKAPFIYVAPYLICFPWQKYSFFFLPQNY